MKIARCLLGSFGAGMCFKMIVHGSTEETVLGVMLIPIFIAYTFKALQKEFNNAESKSND